jgi:hypothetical protein
VTAGVDVVVEDGLPVTLPSGATFSVLTSDEVEYVKDRVTRYLADNHFVNVSDLQDVDRMVVMELLVHRWSLWLSRGKDYFDDEVDEKSFRRSLGEYSTEVRQLKKALGIDKVTRDKQKGDDSVPTYLTELNIRALEFGYMRNAQQAKSIELFMQLRSLVTLHDNSDDQERMEMHCSEEDIFEWMRVIAFPEFDAIDADFRKGHQAMWIRKM